MKENKNIERLFQEKFKDFEVSPPDFVWENIQEKLHPEKKKRRVLPFWFKATGIAASFVALFSMLYFNSNSESTNAFTTDGFQNNQTTVSGIKDGSKSSNQNTNQNSIESTNSENSANYNSENSAFKKNNSVIPNNSTVSNDSENKLDGNSSRVNSKFKNASLKNNTVSKKGITLRNDNALKSNNISKGNNVSTKENALHRKTKASKWYANSDLASNTKQKSKTQKGKKAKATINNELTLTNSENAVALNQNYLPNSKKTTTDLEVNTTNSLRSSNAITNQTLVTENKNLENNTNTLVAVEEPKTDSIVLATITIEENPMEKLLREKETKKVAKEKEDFSKWAINSYVSPVYFNSFSEGSPLSKEFASNEKTFSNSTSYGVGVSYQLSKKLAVKTGLANLNLDYTTNNISFYSSFDDQTSRSDTNIKRNRNGKYLVLRNQLERTVNIEENQIFASAENEGSLNQEIQYVEVPMEVSYALLDKKFGVAVKGGMSTLFLTKNSVSIETTNGLMEIGKASNLSSVHFSSNIGLGFSYNFMKNFQANIEPTLKYQINTFNENAGNFKPYVVGINTGISYKF